MRGSGDQRKHKTYPLLKLENPSGEPSGDIAAEASRPRPVARRSGDAADLGDDEDDDDDHADNLPPGHGERTCRYKEGDMSPMDNNGPDGPMHGPHV